MNKCFEKILEFICAQNIHNYSQLHNVVLYSEDNYSSTVLHMFSTIITLQSLYKRYLYYKLKFAINLSVINKYSKYTYNNRKGKMHYLSSSLENTIVYKKNFLNYFELE